MQEQRWLTFLNGQICLSEHLLWSLVHKIRGVQQKILSTTSVFWKCEHCPRDIKKAIFSEVLRFIYSGKISSDDSLKNLARDILIAANKYQLDLLKKLCEAQLQSTLNARNCFDLLVLGDLHQAANLKMAALHFVSMNSASLIETDVYKDFFHNQRSDLVFEVTKSMFLDKEISSLGASSNNNNWI